MVVAHSYGYGSCGNEDLDQGQELGHQEQDGGGERSSLLPPHSQAHTPKSNNHSKKLCASATLLLFIGVTLLITQQFSRPLITITENTSFPVPPLPKYYFAPSTGAHPPSALWGSIQKPYPTGAFWTNLVVNDGDGAVAVLPYGVKCLTSGVQVSYGPTRRDVTNEYVRDTFASDLELSSKEAYVKHEAVGYDELSVTMQYIVQGGGKIRFPLVKGSPFVTAVYSGSSLSGQSITPVIKASTMKILDVETRQFTMTSSPHWYSPFIGTQETTMTYYIVTLGNFQKWLVVFYASDDNLYAKPFFHWNKEQHSLIGHTISKGVTAYVRVAILPASDAENAVKVLLGYGPRYPIGGHTTVKIVRHSDAHDTAVVSYTFDSEQVTEEVKQRDLLMLALPHHVNSMSLPHTRESIVAAASVTCSADSTMSATMERVNVISCLSPIYSLKGKMTPIIGNTWTLIHPLSEAPWMYSVDPSDPISTDHLSTIGQALVEEVKMTYLEEPEDPYTVGKALARLATLALIADNLGKKINCFSLKCYTIKLIFITGIAGSRERALQEIQSGIISWIVGSNADNLLYDLTFGGVVPQRGLLDSQADYGSGLYNDHHFHYGYFIHTGAVLAKLSPAFFVNYQPFFDTLVSDICNPSHTNELFPYVRHKDMFDGHSWASGLFQQANGKNQESSSESVNAYYAVTLYAEATGQKELRDFAQVMLTMEIQSVQTYWHVSDTRVYDKLFGFSLGMVGNVGGFDVTTSTWFGRNEEYVYGINIMPLTPVTANLFSDEAFLNTNFARLDSLLDSFVPISDAPSNAPTVMVTMSEAMTKCAANEECTELEMQGECCPTTDGTMLACCDASPAYSPVMPVPVQLKPGQAGDITGEWKAIMFSLYGCKF